MKTKPVIEIALILGLSFGTFSCQEEKEDVKKVDTEQEAENLMQTSRDWSAVAVSRDAKKVLEYWGDDAVMMSCGEATIKGKDAIREMIEGSLNDPNFSISWEPISAEVSENGDMGYLLETSKITMTDSTGASNTMNFDSVTIWKKQDDGTWKNVVDVMSSNE